MRIRVFMLQYLPPALWCIDYPGTTFALQVYQQKRGEQTKCAENHIINLLFSTVSSSFKAMHSSSSNTQLLSVIQVPQQSLYTLPISRPISPTTCPLLHACSNTNSHINPQLILTCHIKVLPTKTSTRNSKKTPNSNQITT